MTNNQLRSDLTKAVNELTTSTATVLGYRDLLPEDENEASANHATGGGTIADAAAALDTSIGLVAWVD